jgi:acyl-CoA synthetase (AMP-forming)/AMP-acid ligase II
MFDASQRAASAFQAQGLRRGDLVALIVDEAEDFLTALIGASSAGIIPASLYPPATFIRSRSLFQRDPPSSAPRSRLVTTAALAAECEICARSARISS